MRRDEGEDVVISEPSPLVSEPGLHGLRVELCDLRARAQALPDFRIAYFLRCAQALVDRQIDGFRESTDGLTASRVSGDA